MKIHQQTHAFVNVGNGYNSCPQIQKWLHRVKWLASSPEDVDKHSWFSSSHVVPWLPMRVENFVKPLGNSLHRVPIFWLCAYGPFCIAYGPFLFTDNQHIPRNFAVSLDHWKSIIQGIIPSADKLWAYVKFYSFT